LKRRRSRGDLIKACKIITGKDALQWERFFKLAANKTTCAHRYKLLKKPKGAASGQKFLD